MTTKSETSKSEFSISVSHGQIAVFDSSLTEPFNDWTEQYSAQGFTWRLGSVSFAPLEEAGMHRVIVDDDKADKPSFAAVRVIDVPFTVPATGKIEIASIADSRLLDMRPGLYQLRFQNFAQVAGEPPLVIFSFRTAASPIFEVVRADDALNLGEKLLLSATSA